MCSSSSLVQVLSPSNSCTGSHKYNTNHVSNGNITRVRWNHTFAKVVRIRSFDLSSELYAMAV